MATVTRENIGLLSDKLTVHVDREDYLPAFERKVKEFAKTANVPGFRKGMVPAGLVRKMYGAALFHDEVIRAAEKKLYAYLSEEKPDIFAQPLPVADTALQLDHQSPVTYDFQFEIGLKPTYDLPNFSAHKLTWHNVDATDAMVEEELNRMQIKGGKMTEPETIDSDENVLNVTFIESDQNGLAVPDGISKDNSLLLKYFAPAMQQSLMGKKAGDHIIFQLNKTFEADKLEMMLKDLGLDPADQQAGDKFFRMDITKLGLIEKRTLDADFFNEVYPGKSIATEDEFRKELKNDIQAYWQSQSRNQFHDQIYHLLLDHVSMEFPEAFLKRWLQTGGEKPKTAEEAEAEYPTFKNQLKWTLISDRIVRENNLEVNQDEVRQHLKEDVMRYFGQMGMDGQLDWLDSYVERMMKDEKQIESTYRKLITSKLFNHVESIVGKTEKTVTPDELNAMQHHHH
ncbi:MAG: trigger factor [Ferruginibacter sp.]